MRALLGWLTLLALCGLYGYLQTREGRTVQAEEAPAGPVARTLAEREATWHALRVGRPSGAEPIELQELAPPAIELEDTPLIEDPGSGIVDTTPAPPPPPPVHEYTVPKGRVLSKICEQFYETGRPPVPQRLAEYNGLGSPDELRAGFVLKLPAWEVLFPEGRERP